MLLFVTRQLSLLAGGTRRGPTPCVATGCGAWAVPVPYPHRARSSRRPRKATHHRPPHPGLGPRNGDKVRARAPRPLLALKFSLTPRIGSGGPICTLAQVDMAGRAVVSARCAVIREETRAFRIREAIFGRLAWLTVKWFEISSTLRQIC